MKMKRAIIGLISAAALSAGVLGAGFERINTYTDNMFADVASESWYASEVKNTYELGLMNGTGAGLFNPDGNVTVAEALTMASRAHSIYNGTVIAESSGDEWYKKYVDYAVNNGIITDNSFDNFDRAAKRYEVACVFLNAMPDGYYTAVNNVDKIPYIPKNADYYNDLLVLYNAGIVMGSDAYGNFFPENNITRAEAAAIINRVSLPENRLKKELDKISDDGAYQLIITQNFNGTKEGIASGWELDNTGGYPRNKLEGGYTILTDISETDGTAVIRYINETAIGLIHFDFKLTLSGESCGAYVEMQSTEGKPIYKLVADEGNWNILMSDGGTKSVFPTESKSFVFKVIIDLDNRRSTTYVNAQNCGTYAIDFGNLQRMIIGTGEKETGSVSLSYVRAYANYAVFDDFIYSEINKLPFGWDGYNSAVSSGSVLKIDASGNAGKTFIPVSGKVIGEFTAFVDSDKKFSYAMKSGTKDIITLSSDGRCFVACGKNIYEFVPGMWYRFRIEADTEKMTVIIKINGRNIAEVDFALRSASIDAIQIANIGSDAVETDDYKVFSNVECEDYVPAPKKCEGEENYNIGINVCSLWQNGVQNGWSCITPYEDIEPVLGYYDEGNPETADWEIKYMVDHGIDFQAFCWFADKNNQPLKTPSHSAHLHDGYINAKYSNMMSYCLIWEAVNGLRPSGMTAWKNYYVPYLIENYFKDPRYMKIDNMPVFIVFGASKLTAADSFGHADSVKEAFDYLEEEVKKLGFDGMIYLSCGEAATVNSQMGFDGNYAYSWGYEGYSVKTNVDGNINSAKIMYSVPTVSVGFNNIGWSYTRRPLMSIEDYKTVNTWVRDEYLPEYAEKGTWKEKLVMISTWNEYGEGTYIMPCEGLNGFGYLDTIREVYTDSKTDTSVNIIPTESQKKRITRLYPQHKHLLRKDGLLKAKSYDEYEVVHRIDVTDKNVVLDGAVAQPDDLMLTGVTTNNDPKVMVNLGKLLPIDNVSAVRVRMKAPAGSIQMFFTTVADTAASSDKCCTVKSESDEMTDYIFDFSENKKWTGSLTLFLRIDPVSAPDVEFSIQSVEFLSAGETASKIMFIDDKELQMNMPYEVSTSGDTLFAFDPSLAMDYMFGAYHTWDNDNKILKVTVNGHTFVYTVGSDSYTVDGNVKMLGFNLYETDGLPMLPLEKFCNDAGFLCFSSPDGSGAFVISTHQKEFLDEIAEQISHRKEGSWDFDVIGDTELWNSSNLSLSTASGRLSAVSSTSGTDPSIIYGGKLSLSTDRYTKLEFRVRYKYTAEKPSAIHMYYVTDIDKTWNEAKAIYLRLNSTDSEGEWETYTADLSNVGKWEGTVMGLRLDPFNANGSMEFDYIRFLEDDNYVHVDPENIPFSLAGGNAENITHSPFYSENANISLVKDPENENNTCYLIMSRGGNSYCYFQQKVYFKPGMTYKVEFDVKLAALDSNMNPPKEMKSGICCNFRFADPKGRDHIIGNVKPSVADGWVHFSAEYTVDESCTDRSGDQFTIYSNPVDNLGVGFYVDNITVTEV